MSVLLVPLSRYGPYGPSPFPSSLDPVAKAVRNGSKVALSKSTDYKVKAQQEIFECAEGEYDTKSHIN